MVVLFLISVGTSTLFSLMAILICITNNSVQRFPFFHIFFNTGYLWLFGNNHLPRVWFWFACLWWSVMLSIFSYACWPSAYPLWKMSIQVLFFFAIDCVNSVYILDINLLSDMTYKIFLPFCGLPFHRVAYPLCCAETFQTDVVPCIYFCFCYLCFWS